MPTDRRAFLIAAGASALAASLPARADSLADIRKRGSLRVAVYNSFPPYSNQGKGIDVDLAEALGKQLGLAVQVVGYNADEDMDDDLRNMVWKGHYLGAQPSDVMMHVPVDSYLQGKNDKVRIFGPYHLETVAVARDPARVNPLRGSAANALELFTREKIAVEGRSLTFVEALAAPPKGFWIEPTRGTLERQRARGTPMEIIVFEGATHAFEDDRAEDPRVRYDYANWAPVLASPINGGNAFSPLSSCFL